MLSWTNTNTNDMGLNTKDNQFHWERFQKRQIDRIKRKEARRNSEFLRNLCRATAHVENDSTSYYITTSPAEPFVENVTFTCSRCGSQAKSEKIIPSKYRGIFTTFTTIYGTTTGRIKSSGSP